MRKPPQKSQQGRKWRTEIAFREGGECVLWMRMDNEGKGTSTFLRDGRHFEFCLEAHPHAIMFQLPLVVLEEWFSASSTIQPLFHARNPLKSPSHLRAG